MYEANALQNALRIQAGACEAFGSPFSAALLNGAAQALPHDSTLLELLGSWRGAPVPDLLREAVPLRLLGAIHELVLKGDAPDLSEAWPTRDRKGDTDAAWRAARRRLAEVPGVAAAFMEHEPQTNEVRRSACLLQGFLTVAEQTGMDLRCFELGASAGLNQLWDKWDYAFGEVSWGAGDAPLLLDTQWRGPTPLLRWPVRVRERAACDRKPVDLRDPDARRRLRAYVWADQVDRLERLDMAITAALAAGLKVDEADAAQWTALRVAPRDGAATVLFHSVFWQYMGPGSQTALTRVINAFGAQATFSAPFAWLRMEPDPANPAIMEVRLTLWPDGRDRLLAHAHPHGAWVDSTAARSP